MNDGTKKHDVPRVCPGPWRLARGGSIIPGLLYLYRCEACGDERLAISAPKRGRTIDARA